MPRQSTLVASAALFAFMHSCPVLVRAEQAEWTVGLDLTLEGSAGLLGEAPHGQALNGLALAHADWKPAQPPGDGLRYRGYISALALAGRGPTTRFLGDFLAASNIEGHPSARLYSWWLEASKSEWSLRAGALLADAEFGGTKAGGNFFNSAFGWPSFISANTVNTGPAFYVAGLGLRLEHKWGETAAWRGGIYDGDTFDSPTGNPAVNPHGVHYKLGGDQGWFLITEASFTPAGDATRLKVGTWLHTARFPDVRDDASGQPFAISGEAPREHRSNYGTYVVIEHTLVGKPGQAGNLEVFVRGGASPADRSSIAWAIDTGLGWTGPIPGRPSDVAALGLAHAKFSSRFSDNARFANPTIPAPDFEQVLEASYTILLSERLNVQPDVQFIRNPGGSTAQRDALAFLLRVNASY